ncbi:Hsp70 family protein [Nocardia sp. NPDC005978]|uniref:Hsp70 family protein n=1 Tax=Nocardia sp. NPDC005978 TaxID=3156725 RepID=UPI0033BB2C23
MRVDPGCGVDVEFDLVPQASARGDEQEVHGRPARRGLGRDLVDQSANQGLLLVHVERDPFTGRTLLLRDRLSDRAVHFDTACEVTDFQGRSARRDSITHRPAMVVRPWSGGCSRFGLDRQRVGGDVSRMIGIDLGTSKALAATVEGGRTVLIPPSEGTAALLRAGRFAESELLSALRRDAEQQLGQAVTGVVVSNRAADSDAGRRRLVLACESAGFSAVRVVSPTAAAGLGWAAEGAKQERTAVIIDLGRAGCEVAVVSAQDGVAEMGAVVVDSELAGSAWDRRIADRLVQAIRLRYGVDASGDTVVMGRLLEAAESAKVALSSAQSADVTVPYIIKDAAGEPVTLQDAVSRTEFDRSTADLVDRCRDAVRTVLKESWNVDAVDEVVLVGGGARIPAIAAMIRQETGREPARRILPEQAVVAGAALQAAVLRGANRDLILLDTARRSIGIELADGRLHVLVERGSTIETRRSLTVTTTARDQRSVLIRVFEGEHPVALANSLLGEMRLTGMPSGAAGTVTIEISCQVDVDSVVRVTARESGSSQELTLHANGLTPPTENRFPSTIEAIAEHSAADGTGRATAAPASAPESVAAPQQPPKGRGIAKAVAIIGAVLVALSAWAWAANSPSDNLECGGSTMKSGDICHSYSYRSGNSWDTTYDDRVEGAANMRSSGRIGVVIGLVLLVAGGVGLVATTRPEELRRNQMRSA